MENTWKISNKLNKVYAKLSKKLKEKDGGDYVETGIKILIGVVIGALLLGGLYLLFGDIILPTLTERIQDMFNYSGSQ